MAQANEQRAVETQTANKAKLDQTQSVLDNFAADLFQGGGGGSQMSVALGATSADDFATRVVLADQVTSLTDNALKELQNARAEATAQESYLKAVEAEVTQLKHEAEDALAKAQAARTAAATAKTNLDTLLTQQSAYAAQVESKKAAEQPAARRRRGRAGQAARPPSRPRRAPQRAAEAARAAAARAAGRQLRARHRRHRLPQPRRQRADHLAVRAAVPPDPARTGGSTPARDFGVPCGTPVYAAADGTSSAPAGAAATATASSSTTASSAGSTWPPPTTT